MRTKGSHGEMAFGEGHGGQQLGGGYRLIPKLSEEGIALNEMVTTAAGGRFTDNRGDLKSFYGFSQHATREPVNHRRTLLDEGYRLWKYDPLGGIIVNLTTFFVLGRGITIHYDDPVSNLVLKKFWKKNRLARKFKQICHEGTAFGENFIHLKVHKRDVKKGARTIWRAGDVELVTYDPKNIVAIEHAADNACDVHSYLVSHIGEKDVEKKKKIVDISKFDPARDAGCMVHIKFNSATSDIFGLSDLVRIKDWLDNYQDYLRDGVVINKLFRSPCYDITLKDGTEDDVNNAISRYSSWKIGSNAVHNDKEEWKILEFTGSNQRSEDARRALLLIIAAGVGMPEYMLADGSNGNMASTKSQQLPAIKKFEDRQDIYGDSLVEIFDFVLQAKATYSTRLVPMGDVDPEGDVTYHGQVKFPEISREEDSVVAQYTAQLMESGLISRSTASLMNNTNYGDEIAKMAADSIALADKMESTLKQLVKSGVDPNVAQSIVDKCFVAAMVSADEKTKNEKVQQDQLELSKQQAKSQAAGKPNGERKSSSNSQSS